MAMAYRTPLVIRNQFSECFIQQSSFVKYGQGAFRDKKAWPSFRLDALFNAESRVDLKAEGLKVHEHLVKVDAPAAVVPYRVIDAEGVCEPDGSSSASSTKSAKILDKDELIAKLPKVDAPAEQQLYFEAEGPLGLDIELVGSCATILHVEESLSAAATGLVKPGDQVVKLQQHLVKSLTHETFWAMIGERPLSIQVKPAEAKLGEAPEIKAADRTATGVWDWTSLKEEIPPMVAARSDARHTFFSSSESSGDDSPMPKVSSLVEPLRTENAELKVQLTELQVKFDAALAENRALATLVGNLRTAAASTGPATAERKTSRMLSPASKSPLTAKNLQARAESTSPGRRLLAPRRR